jgi:hypothetical protein
LSFIDKFNGNGFDVVKFDLSVLDLLLGETVVDDPEELLGFSVLLLFT